MWLAAGLKNLIHLKTFRLHSLEPLEKEDESLEQQQGFIDTILPALQHLKQLQTLDILAPGQVVSLKRWASLGCILQYILTASLLPLERVLSLIRSCRTGTHVSYLYGRPKFRWFWCLQWITELKTCKMILGARCSQIATSDDLRGMVELSRLLDY